MLQLNRHLKSENFGLIKLFLAVISGSLIFQYCERPENSIIIYESVNQDIVLIRDLSTLRESNDDISLHVDSILNGYISAEFISTGQKYFRLDDDTLPDLAFEIIDLNLFNPQGLPEHFDSLAARVIPVNLEILDNSTYSYPDALIQGEEISSSGYWSTRTGVLGTFMNAGQFQGQGEKYLGIRLSGEKNYNYGWIKIYCSMHSDTLRIIEYAYNQISGASILAGQKE